jgi:hypothetical protein
MPLEPSQDVIPVDVRCDNDTDLEVLLEALKDVAGEGVTLGASETEHALTLRIDIPEHESDAERAAAYAMRVAGDAVTRAKEHARAPGMNVSGSVGAGWPD